MAEGKFQVAVGAVLGRPDGMVLLLRRRDSLPGGGVWEGPIGRLKQFESFEAGLRREVQEESGITRLKIIAPISAFTFMRGAETAENEVKGTVFACQTDEQTVTLSDEHDDYRWLPITAAIALANHPGIKRDLQAYQRLLLAREASGQAWDDSLRVA